MFSYPPNISLESLVKGFGSPLYVYDSERILQQYHKLKIAFKANPIRILYAVKALSNINILKYMKTIGANIDAVSIQEVHLALAAGFVSDQILFTPSGVSFQEIREAVELKVLVNIDNLQNLDYFGAQYGSSYPCCVRLNPHILAGGNSKIQVGSIDSKFGISIFQVSHIKRLIEIHNIRVIGLHMHTGSDILDGQVFLQAAQVLLDAAHDFDDLNFIDFGSGFKVAYKTDDVTTDLKDFGLKLDRAFSDFVRLYGHPLEIWFEPGKFLVSEAGYLLVTVNGVKHTPSCVFATVDSGLNHLIRPMMYNSYHHISNASNPKGKQKIYTVVGYICENDTFGSDRQIAEIKEGDILVIHNAGAYGYSMSSNYNSRYRPAEVLLKDGKAHLIQKRETMQDLLKNQILVL